MPMDAAICRYMSVAGGVDVMQIEIAYLLGFSEPSAFQHACKRWFDKSAGELRKQLIDTSGIKT